MADEPSDAITEPTDAPAAEPTDVPDLAALSRDELAAEVDATAARASELAAAEDFTAEAEEAFNAALARHEAATAELANRDAATARHAAARDRAASLAAAPAAPAVPAAPAPVVPSVASLAAAPTVPPVPTAEPAAADFRMVAAADAAGLVPGLAQGAEFTSMEQLGRVIEAHYVQVGTGNGAGKVSRGLATIQRTNREFRIGDNERENLRTIERVSSERRLPGGSLMASWQKSIKDGASLTAAAGWCAPSITDYSLCELESTDGMWDLPEMTTDRGGVRWTQGLTWAQIQAATTFTNLTEAQVIADTPKVCSEIPCPTFTDTRLNAAATCVTGSFLQWRGYPELHARFVRGALVNHAAQLNELRIVAAVAQAGAATAITAPTDDAAVSAILSAVELAAIDIRTRNRMPVNSTLEVLLPTWVIGAMRADWARRQSGTPDLADSMIVDWFSRRNIRPQFVYDWQNFYSGVVAPSFGSGAPFVTGYPATVEFLIYPAGAVVSVVQDVVTLRSVYDAASLAQNLFTELFTEEGWGLIYPCPDLRRYSVALCPSGAVGPREDWGCETPIP